MSDQQKEAIKNFFEAAEQLKTLGIVRSSSYTGNIAEFVCADLFNINLSDSQRETGLDGSDPNGRKVEIKYHNGTKGTNIILSKYGKQQNFVDLIVILGPQSKLRPSKTEKNTYLIYRFDDYDVGKEGNIAKKKLKDDKLKFVLDKDLKQINRTEETK